VKTVLSLAAAVAMAAASTGASAADTIVNIKGYDNDGAGAQIFSYPVSAGTLVSLFNPVLLDLPAGDYTLSDAWGQPGALYDAWNFQLGAAGSWASHYVVAESLGNGQYSVLLDAVGKLDPTCQNHFCAWSTQDEARDAFLATAPFVLHLDHVATVAFAAADYNLADNAGGMSVRLVGAVPEPATYALTLGGLALVALLVRRRKG